MYDLLSLVSWHMLACINGHYTPKATFNTTIVKQLCLNCLLIYPQFINTGSRSTFHVTKISTPPPPPTHTHTHFNCTQRV